MKPAPQRESRAAGRWARRAAAWSVATAAAAFAGQLAAQEVGSVPCTSSVDVAALVRALGSRAPVGSVGWEIGVRGSDCIVTVTDGGGVWPSGIRADRETMLVAAEVSWSWMHRARSLDEARTAGRTLANETALQARLVETSATPVAAAVPPLEPHAPAPVAERAEGRVGLGATALNGHAVSTLTAGYSVPVSAALRAGAEGWCSLARVDSQFLYVDSSIGSSARPGVQVASLGGFLASSSRWAGLDIGIRSGLGLVWAQSTLESALASVSESAWLPEASVHGRLGVRFGSAEPAIEIGYRAVVGDDKVVGPSLWAFAGPSASLSLGWSVQ